MNQVQLARAFRRIVATVLPIQGGALLVGCGSSSVTPYQAPPNGDGAVDAVGSVANDDAALRADSSPSPDGALADGATGAVDAEAGASTDSNQESDAVADTNDAGVGLDASEGADAVGDSSDAGDAASIVTSCGVVPVRPLACYPQCVALEAGALNGVDAGDSGSLFGFAQCDPLCGPGVWFSCEPFTDKGASMVRCYPMCTGRRPEGLGEQPPARGTLAGAYLVEMARLEAASVLAFKHLRRELVAHRAPRRLVRAAERAARDERRHARTTRALARRDGGTPVPPTVERVALRGLEAMATENAVEGCVREAFGALVAHWQSVVAGNPVVRAAMARIARDETRHAVLALEVQAWLRGRLDAPARWRVDDARRRAIDSVLAGAEEPAAALRTALGLPTRRQSRALAERMAQLAT